MLNLTGTDDASKQALADASERYTAASSQIDQATTAKQALLAKESAIEGLYYTRAARVARMARKVNMWICPHNTQTGAASVPNALPCLGPKRQPAKPLRTRGRRAKRIQRRAIGANDEGLR